jgi:hypothetical protein
MRKTATALIAGLIAFSVIPTVSAQIENCGVVDVVFLNPDLNDAASNGRIDANGAVFVQFQVIGERAADVAYIGFSFGVDTVPQDSSACPEAENYDGNYFSGQQIQNYRADTDASDGFFINLQTTLVPDGDYTAAVHAYTKDDEELGRFWARAEVKNCDDDDEDGRCADDVEMNRVHDKTVPWPIILPGDGEWPDTADFPSKGFSIEIAEPLGDPAVDGDGIEVILNGVDISDQLVLWDGRQWDNDLRPGYGPYGALGDNEATSECAYPEAEVPQANDCEFLGEAYRWEERKLEKGDVLNVKITDVAGNIAKKDVHVGYGINGGISSGAYPILQWTADQVVAEVQAGTSAVFSFKTENLGAETGHPFARDELQIVPEGWTFDWSAHQPVNAGEDTTNSFTIHVPDEAVEGRQQVTVGMSYKGQNGEEVDLQQILSIDVTGGADASITGEEIEEEQESPAAALPIIIAMLAGLLVVRRRA